MQPKIPSSSDEFLRSAKIGDAHGERFNKITKDIFSILTREQVTVGEFPQVLQALNAYINSFMAKAEFKQSSDLNEKL